MPPLATLTVTLVGIGSASFWRDEAATLTATRRSLPQLVWMLRHLDAVHGFYYLLMWPVAHLFGSGELAMRLPSALAMSAAALGVTLIGRRLASGQAGVAAGLVFAVLPMTSRFGQEARSYAAVTAVGVLASYLLIRLNEEPGRRWPVAYGAALTGLGLLNVFALLIIPAHGMTLAAWLRRPGPAGGRGVRAWAVPAALAGAVAAPVALAAWAQRHQLGWLYKPAMHDIRALLLLATGSVAASVLVAALAAAGVIRSYAGGRKRDAAAGGGRRLGWLAAPWLILPPGLLLAVSEIRPVYVDRYVVFCLPAAALLAGAGLANLGRYLPAVVLGVLVTLALPVQSAIRGPVGHGDDIRGAARLLQAHARPGDALLYRRPGFRDLGAVYPYGFARLRDVGLAESATAAGNLSGTEVGVQVLQQRLRTVNRVWLVQVGGDDSEPILVGPPRFQLAGTWRKHDILLRLYIHRRGAR